MTHHAADACQPLLGACLLARVSFVRLPPSASANGRSIGDSNPDGLARRQLPCIPLKGSNLRPRRLRLCALPLPELLERGDLRLALEIPQMRVPDASVSSSWKGQERYGWSGGGGECRRSG